MGSAAGAAKARAKIRPPEPEPVFLPAAAEPETGGELQVVDNSSLVQTVATAVLTSGAVDAARLMVKTVRNKRAALTHRLLAAGRVLDLAGVGIKPGANPGAPADVAAAMRALALRQSAATATDAQVIEPPEFPIESVDDLEPLA